MLAGCAYLSGPCEVQGSFAADGSVSRHAVCEVGGTMVIWPAPDVDQLLLERK